ncbi:hypothetical protein N7466_002866 [Penicillium verhagenii]|uniref:uncharacterized protein n=1 Tax=Penicillium verhagenii TaxID=1562060 RepID=UPI002544DC29|nr:uncharacterized protein N7466_002866 [Penicillium verhagenii]KAJ5939732.1 hypothetical protein N7466_002866 [Penicillium verhagenii]
MEFLRLYKENYFMHVFVAMEKLEAKTVKPPGQMEHLTTKIQQMEGTQIQLSSVYRNQSKKVDRLERTIRQLEAMLDEKEGLDESGKED